MIVGLFLNVIIVINWCFLLRKMQIEQDNPVRFVDAFVEHLDLNQLGFVVSALKTEGRLAFELKLF